MSNQLDLRQLAYERSAPTAPSGARRRPIISRYVIPGVILLGFVGMIGWASRDYFLVRVPVTVVPVIVGRADVRAGGSSLFQAAGWIEPRPTAILVSALADGVVAELSAVEGQSIEAGAEIARLNDLDVKIAIRQAEAELRLREADLEFAVAQRKAAQQRLKQPLHLQAALADAETQLSKSETELTKIPYLLKSAESRVELARKNLESKKSLDGVVSGRVIQQAESEHTIAVAEFQELEGRKPRLESEVKSLQRKQDALAQQMNLLTDEIRQASESEAQERAAEARRSQAELAVEQAKIQLDRMIVRAPISGRVLSLIARPGVRVSANANASPASQAGSAAIVSLYDPKHLQVRADVRLEDVPLVQQGQPVHIKTASSKTTIQGKVLMATSTANIQKNTLEVKIAIDNPPEEIRPEMLVTAEFLAPDAPAGETKEAIEQDVLLVPRALVQKEIAGASIWVAGSDGLARKAAIRLGKESTGKMVEVVEGLTATDKLIVGGREGVQEGARILITGEDATYGTNATE